jgi:putative sugar O-methyltransferase
LGPGYGRTAYFIKRFKPDVQYVFVDIPPALYIAQRYMKQVFPKSRIFNFRPFESYNEVRSEIEKADLVFLLPHQMEKLPKKWADMFINISSLHEMIPKQIKYYINQADRLTREYFYFKQWISDKMPEENIVISEKDYPIPKKLKKIYRRNCKVHTSFFESLYKI